MSTDDYDAIRPCMERWYAEDGLTLTDREWHKICETVDKAPPLTDMVLRRITNLMVPVPKSTLAPDAATPSARTRQALARSRRRASGRAA